MRIIWDSNYVELCRNFGFVVALIISNFGVPGIASAWDNPVAIDMNTSSGLRADTHFTLAGEGNLVGVVWSSTSAASGDFGVRFSRSSDGGASWSSSVDLSDLNGAGSGAFGDNPALAMNGNTWLAAWDAGNVLEKTIDNSRDIFLRRSTDAGQTWSSPQLMNSDFSDSAVRNYSPVLAGDGAGTWIALWESEILDSNDKYVKRTISMSRSLDNGINWSGVERLEALTTSPLRLNSRPVTDGDGVWIAAWEVTGPNSHIRVFRSVNNGQTWTQSAELDADGDPEESNVSYNGQPSIATNGEDNWGIVWTSNFNSTTNMTGNDQIHSVRSSDDGASWSSSSQVSASSYYNQTPDIVWDSEQFLTVWSNPAGFEAAASADAGLDWTDIQAPGTQGSSFDGGKSPAMVTPLTFGKLAAWLHHSPGATGPDLVASRETGPASAEKWSLY